MIRTREIPYRDAAPSPIARFEGGVAVVRGKLYVVGGHTGPKLKATRRMFVYDPQDDVWTSCADAPLAISHVTAAVVDNRYIWIAGGYQGDHPGSGVADSFRYDVDEDRWEPGPALPAVRASAGFALVGRHLHFFGGIGADRRTNYGDHWLLDVDDPAGWERQAPMPQPRTHAATAVHGGYIYAIGGHFGHDKDARSRDEVDAADLDLVHRYDPATDRWEEVAPLRRRRSHCEPGTFVFRDKIVCVAGRNNSPDAVSRYDTLTLALQIRRAIRKVKRILNPPKISGLDDVIAYDPATDRWFDWGTLPEPLYAPAAAVIGDEVIVSGGGRHGWREPLDTTIRFQLPELA